MFKRIVAGVVLSTGVVLALTGCSDDTSTPVPAATVTVTAKPVTKPTADPTMSISDAVALVRQQGSADIATWSDEALAGQFVDVCAKFDRGWSFDRITLDLVNRDIASFSGADAGTVIAGSVISTCPQYTATISNL